MYGSLWGLFNLDTGRNITAKSEQNVDLNVDKGTEKERQKYW